MKKWWLACSTALFLVSAITAQAGVQSTKPEVQNNSTPAKIETPSVQAPIVVSNARIRLMPSGADSSALYLTLKNNGKKTAQLTGAEVFDTNDHKPLAKEVMLHQTVTEGNVKRMAHMDSIDILPGKSTRLKPGGNHIMLIGLNHPLKAGEIYDLKLSFADKSVIFTTVQVKKIAFKKKPALTKEWKQWEEKVSHS